MEPPVVSATIEDLGVAVNSLEDFWDGREAGFLHQALYIHEFGDTALAVHDPDGELLAYLLGFVGPRKVGYIHAVAVRGAYRGQGLARALYDAFAERARAQGASALKAITAPENERSIAFHRALGFTVEEVPRYTSLGESRIVFRREL